VYPIAVKVAVQIQAKMGAEPWRIEIPLRNMMVVGYDSYHDTDRQNKSFGAMVSTTNTSLTRFHSSCVEHGNYEELHPKIGECFISALRAYQKGNEGELPKYIVFYRDGVGDGQIQQVRESPKCYFWLY